jgi:hypothetical protein
VFLTLWPSQCSSGFFDGGCGLIFFSRPAEFDQSLTEFDIFGYL